MESTLVRLGVPAIALALLGLFALGTFHAERRLGAGLPAARRRSFLAFAGMGAWMLALAAAATSGALAHFDLRSLPMMGALIGMLALALGVSLSAIGKRLALGLPLSALVGFQAFRLPLELVMHEAAKDRL